MCNNGNCCKPPSYLKATFKTLDGATREFAVPYPPPPCYYIPVTRSPLHYNWYTGNDISCELKTTSRAYNLRNYDYRTAEYHEVWHDCGVEAAVEKALIKQKQEFKVQFDKLDANLFAQDSDLKSESMTGCYCTFKKFACECYKPKK